MYIKSNNDQILGIKENILLTEKSWETGISSALWERVSFNQTYTKLLVNFPRGEYSTNLLDNDQSST